MSIRISIAVAVGLAIILPGTVAAETYYVSKTGLDTRSGQSWGQAWRTTDKVNASISAGDTVLFGSGRWYNSELVPPSGAGPGWTVYACSTFVDGGDGSDSWHRASICGGDSVTGWQVYDISGGRNIWVADWTGSGCWTGAASNDAGSRSFTLTQNDELLKCVLSVAEIDQEGKWTHIESTGRIYAWIRYGQNPNNLEMLSSCKPAVLFSNDNQDRVLVYGLDLRLGKQGVVLFAHGANDSISIVHCNISRVGHDYGENPAVVMSRAKNLATDVHKFATHVLIQACSISVAKGTGASYYEHAGSGVEMYCTKNSVVDSCWLFDLDGNGVMWKNQNLMNNDSVATGNVVRFSTFENITEFGCVGGNNSYSDSVYGCRFTNIGEAAIEMDHGSDINYGRHFIANNTLYRCNMFLWSRFPQLSADSTSVFKYNIMYDHGADYTFDYSNYWGRFDQPASAYVVDSNIWYDPSASFNGYCGGASSWAGWRSSGFDNNGLNADPMLSNPAVGDFSRPGSNQEMYVVYGGRTWTRWGAWQTDDGSEPPINSDNLALGLTPTVSGTYSGYRPAAATDGNTNPRGGPSTTWASDQSSNPHWITINFGQPRQIEGVRIHWAWNGFASGWTVSRLYHIQTWNGTDYVDLVIVNTTDTLSFATAADTVIGHAGSSATYVSDDSCITITGLTPVTTSRLRLYQPSNMGSVGYPSIMWVAEIQLYDKDIAPPVLDNPDLGAWPGDANGEIELVWTAPGDDGRSGQAAAYVIRYATSRFSPAAWEQQDIYPNLLRPKPAGERETVVMTGLDPGRIYYIAMQAFDEAGNSSPLSDVVSAAAYKSVIPGNDNGGAEMVLLSPGEGETISSSHPILAVQNIDQNTSNRYIFALSREADFQITMLSSPIIYQQSGDVTAWRVDERLAADGRYYWRVVANGTDTSSIYAFTINPQTHAYPNPFVLTESDRAVFTDLPPSGDLILLTVSGEPVRAWANLAGEDIAWDGTNNAGDAVASGTYLWFVEGTGVRGKIIVVR